MNDHRGNSFVVGFDARLTEFACEGKWCEARRREHLMKIDVKIPLSVDQNVWPTPLDPLRIPEWIGPNHSLWSDPRRLAAHCMDSLPCEIERFSLIAVTAPLPTLAAEQLNSHRPSWDWSLPSDSAYSFMGYDVVEEGQISGLSNCGINFDLLEEKVSQSILSALIGDINEYHLFRTKGMAGYFAGLLDYLVPEHAPFDTYGLWSMPVERTLSG